MQHKASILRLKDEIKYLYIKKRRFNTQLLKLHLLVANSWKNWWPYIQNTIEEKNKVVPRLVFVTRFINNIFKHNGVALLKNYEDLSGV